MMDSWSDLPIQGQHSIDVNVLSGEEPEGAIDDVRVSSALCSSTLQRLGSTSERAIKRQASQSQVSKNGISLPCKLSPG